MTMPPQGVTLSSSCILPLVSCAVFKPATIPPLGLERLLRRAEQDKTAGRAGAGQDCRASGGRRVGTGRALALAAMLS